MVEGYYWPVVPVAFPDWLLSLAAGVVLSLAAWGVEAERDDDGARGGAGEAAGVGDGVEDRVGAGLAGVDLHGTVGGGGVIDDDG